MLKMVDSIELSMLPSSEFRQVTPNIGGIYTPSFGTLKIVRSIFVSFIVACASNDLTASIFVFSAAVNCKNLICEPIYAILWSKNVSLDPNTVICEAVMWGCDSRLTIQWSETQIQWAKPQFQ